MNYFFVFIFFLTLGTFLGYVFHRVFHQPWAGRFYRSHMVHHLKLYPATDYYSDKYRKPGKDDTIWLFVIVFVPLIMLIILLTIMSIVSVPMTVMIFMEMGIIGWINDSMHNGFHLKTSSWDIFKFYYKLRKLHFQHHIDMNTNFGIFSFIWDRIFKTFKFND